MICVKRSGAGAPPLPGCRRDPGNARSGRSSRINESGGEAASNGAIGYVEIIVKIKARGAIAMRRWR
jgi:hypothetical protein